MAAVDPRGLGAIAGRAVLAAAAALFGYWAFSTALANVYAATDAPLALALATDNGRIRAQLARQQLAEDPASRESQRAAATNARLALAAEPTAAAAASTLGLVAQLEGAPALARARFGYAERLSRRDLSTELWLIEAAVERGDIAQALRHYDIALRTQNGADEILFPVLTQASRDPAIADGLVQTLRQRPYWAAGFLKYLGDNSGDAAATARFFQRLARERVTVPEGAQSAIIAKLVAAQRYDAAWDYYASLRPGADRRRSRDPGFAAEFKLPAPFDWLVSTDPAFSVALQGGAGQGSLSFAAPPSVGGVLVQQLQLLPPGRYRLEGRGTGVDQAPGERPYWTVRCLGDGRELLRLAIPNAGDGGGRFAGRLVVPTGCVAQWLTLNARPSNATAGLSGEIDHLSLAPESERGK